MVAEDDAVVGPEEILINDLRLCRLMCGKALPFRHFILFLGGCASDFEA